MPSLNRLQLIGHVGRPPEVSYSQGGTAIAKFSIATGHRYKDKAGEWQEETEWTDVVCFGYAAEHVKEKINKGDLVFVEGRKKTDKWKGQDGIGRKSVSCLASSVKFLSSSKGGSSGNRSTSRSDDAGFTDDDIPF